ncbi:hypothetical protein Tco_0650559 [Tanacetum coccineum]
MSSDNASSAVTYTSVSSDSNRPSSWGIPLVNVDELLEMDPYEEMAQQGQAHPLSPAYVPDLMELDEHVPVYVPEPEHLEYQESSDDDIEVEDQPYAEDASPTAESPGYIADSDSMEEDTDEDSIDYPDEAEDGKEDDDEDPEEDPSKEDEPEDDDNNDDTDDKDKEPTEDEEEEHPALTGSSMIPVVDLVPSARDTEAFETDESAHIPRSPQTMVPFSQTRLRRVRKTVRLEPPMSAFMEARIAEHAVTPIPPTSSAYDQAPLGHRTAIIRMREDIPEEDMPPRRRFVRTAPPPGCDVAESSAAATARAPRAGNPVKKILLKLNLSDHRSILMDLKVTPTKPGRMTKLYSSPRFIANYFNARYLKMEVPDSSCLTRSIATCSYPINKHKLTNLKKDATLKFSSQQIMKGMSMSVQKSQVHKMERFIKIATRLRVVDDLKMLKNTMSNTSSRNKLNPEINDHYNIFIKESQEYDLKTKDEA